MGSRIATSSFLAQALQKLLHVIFQCDVLCWSLAKRVNGPENRATLQLSQLNRYLCTTQSVYCHGIIFLFFFFHYGSSIVFTAYSWN